MLFTDKHFHSFIGLQYGRLNLLLDLAYSSIKFFIFLRHLNNAASVTNAYRFFLSLFSCEALELIAQVEELL